MRGNWLVGAMVVAALVAGRASAADVINQQVQASTYPIAGFGQADLAQSFQQDAGNISGAGFYLVGNGSSAGSDVDIGLWDALPNQSGRRLAHSAGFAAGGGNGWFDVFWTPVSITANTAYYLVVSGSNPRYVIGGLGNVYAAGQVYANTGFSPYGQFDYSFRTYSSDNVGAVPEPASWALLIVGFGAAGLGLRQARRKYNALSA